MQDFSRMFSGCSDGSYWPGGIWWSFQMKVWTSMIQRNPMIPNYSMIPAIRWSLAIRWSPAIRWSRPARPTRPTNQTQAIRLTTSVQSKRNVLAYKTMRLGVVSVGIRERPWRQIANSTTNLGIWNVLRSRSNIDVWQVHAEVTSRKILEFSPLMISLLDQEWQGGWD